MKTKQLGHRRRRRKNQKQEEIFKINLFCVSINIQWAREMVILSALPHKCTWRFSGQERFEECLMLVCKNSLHSNPYETKASIFKCFSLQALLFQKEEEKVQCIQSPLSKRNWVTIPEHLCRLVSSPMVDSYAKTYHTILGSLQSSIILPSHAGKYAHTQHRYNSQFLKKIVLCCTYISHKNGLAMRWKRVNNNNN